jgi:hypothetical protein
MLVFFYHNFKWLGKAKLFLPVSNTATAAVVVGVALTGLKGTCGLHRVNLIIEHATGRRTRSSKKKIIDSFPECKLHELPCWCIHPLPVNHHPAIWVCQLLVPQTRDRSNAIHRQSVPVVAELESVLYPLSVIVKKVRTHSCKCSQCKLFIFCRPLWSVAQRLIDGIGIDFNVYGGNAADCQLLGMACNPLSVTVGFASIIQHQQARKNKGVLAPHLHGDFRAKALYNLYRAIQEKRSQILDNMADSQTDASATTTEEAKKEDDEEDFMALDRRNDGEKVESTGASVDAVKDELKFYLNYTKELCQQWGGH